MTVVLVVDLWDTLVTFQLSIIFCDLKVMFYSLAPQLNTTHVVQARRSFRAIRGLARLQVVMKGHSVQRQTENTLKCMQLLVRVQNQIHSRRIQMLENQVLQRQAMYKNDQDLESSFGKWMVSLYFS